MIHVHALGMHKGLKPENGVKYAFRVNNLWTVKLQWHKNYKMWYNSKISIEFKKRLCQTLTKRFWILSITEQGAFEMFVGDLN